MKILLIISAVFGLLGVALGAFGAHALKEVLSGYGKTIWEKAVFYQMIHTLAIFIVVIAQNWKEELNLLPTGWGFLIGIVLFSGSLYILALTDIKMLGVLTPFGGIAFIFGWGWLIWQFSKM